MPEIEARVCGIPCIIDVTSYQKVTPACTSGPWEYCYPEEGGEAEWELLDRRGRRAEWLERKMTDRDREKVEELIYDYYN